MTDLEVLKDSYGGGPELPEGAAPQTEIKASATNAYILAYIRKAVIDEVMTPLTKEDIPPHLSKLVSGC